MKLVYNLQLHESGQWGSAQEPQQQLELDLSMLRNGEACTFQDFKDYLEYLGGD